jgi:hypothetical protein
MKLSQAHVRTVMLYPATAATTARTANLDTQGADYATIEILLGPAANTNATGVVLALQESDDTVATNFATFNSSFARTVSAGNTTGVVVVNNVDLKGRKRYLRLGLTPDTTTNGAIISGAVAVLNKEIKGANSANADNVVVG